MSNFKVCILAAGKGIRMGVLTENINKALLPINDKAVISHMIDKFDHDTGIVVAVGYQADKVVEYIRHAHPEHNVEFVYVENYDGKGSGPGLSLLACKDKLKTPFVIATSDTLTGAIIPDPTSENWMGVDAVPYADAENYCTVSHDRHGICELHDKEKVTTPWANAFIGVAGIKDWEVFWEGLENNQSLRNGELQLTNGFRHLISKNLRIIRKKMNWKDTGTLKKYKSAKLVYEEDEFEDSYDFSKINEFTYFCNGRVIKYFEDTSAIHNRCERAKKLVGLAPPVDLQTNSFMSYKRIFGETVYTCMNAGIVTDFLSWAKQHLWHRTTIGHENSEEFSIAATKFYKTKTQKRVHSFFVKYPEFSEKNIVNGVKVRNLRSMLADVPWDSLTTGVGTNFHGDLQFDNVLKTQESTGNKESFQLIDWRGDFGGETHFGDVYYDLGKLYGGLTIPYHLIKQNRFTFNEGTDSISFDFDTLHSMGEGRKIFQKFCEDNYYDWKKIELIRALIFLNMAPLHTAPFDDMLFYLGKYYLNEALNAK
jgi:NDP-sugar pyrophosphorylase family protein